MVITVEKLTVRSLNHLGDFMKIKCQTIWTVSDKKTKKEMSEHRTEREALERVRDLYE